MTATSTASAEAIRGRWQLDRRRSRVGFRVRLLWRLVTVEGQFAECRGRLDLDAHPAIELTIDAASLQTGNRRRDEHLRSGDFFDVGSHPRVQFVAESVEPDGDRLKVQGRLSARGRSIPLALEARVRHRDEELELEAAVEVVHRELGMTYSPLRLIPPRSDLFVHAHLIPDVTGTGASLPSRDVRSDV